MSLNELKRYLYVAPNFPNMSDFHFSDAFLKNTKALTKDVIASGKGNELIDELVNYSNFYAVNYQKVKTISNRIYHNLDAISFILACCSTIKADDTFLHNVYVTLHNLSSTPLHLFAFEYYRKYLVGLELPCEPNNQAQASSSTNNDRTRKIGRGQKKLLIRWYSQTDQINLLRLMTQFKHGYSWSNKDLLKLIHMKPKNEGIFLSQFLIPALYDGGKLWNF